MPRRANRIEALTSALMTDLYELTMAAGYLKSGVRLRATFEMFCHKAPPQRSFFVACGLESAVEYLLGLRFSSEDIEALRRHPVLKGAGRGFFEYLSRFRFTGDVWAVPEGTPFFPLEPIIQVEAPIIEAQIVETYLLSIVHVQTLVATKAARVVAAASADGRERPVIDFGSRRAHGPEAGVLAARAAYIGGCAGTSNVYAGLRFGIPVHGTMAHSWIEAFDSEEEAFRKYERTFPRHTALLIDTYDTIDGARAAGRVDGGISAVRLDSGDMNVLSRRVRKILDGSSLRRTKIIASGNLDEHKIRRLVARRAPVDIFGVGTEMVTSGDLPSLDLIYKLVESATPQGIIRYKAKCSEGKRTLPGRKQVYRLRRPDGRYTKDVICLASERPSPAGRAMLEPVIRGGKLIKALPSIDRVRSRAKREIARLPRRCLDIESGRYMRADVSVQLRALSGKMCPQRMRTGGV